MGSNIAVGALVAGMMSNISGVNQLSKGSQKDLDQNEIEQSIAAALESIEENAPDKLTALAQMKAFLTRLSAEDSSWGQDAQSWIKGELTTANSYQEPADIVKQMEADTKQLQLDQSVLNIDENGLSEYTTDLNNVNQAMDQEKAWYAALPAWKQVLYSAQFAEVMAGLGVQWLWYTNAISTQKNAISKEEASVKNDERQLAADRAQLENDPHLRDMINLLGTNASLMNSNAGAQVTTEQKIQNIIKAIDSAIDGMIKSMASTNQTK